MAEIPQECDFLPWSIQNFVRTVKQFGYFGHCTVNGIILQLLTVFLLPAPWFVIGSFNKKCFVGLVWLTSNHLFGNFWENSPLWFLKFSPNRAPKLYDIENCWLHFMQFVIKNCFIKKFCKQTYWKKFNLIACTLTCGSLHEIFLKNNQFYGMKKRNI